MRKSRRSIVHIGIVLGGINKFALSTQVFDEPDNFVRCVGFRGGTVACGDFGGNVHVWDIRLSSDFKVKNYRSFQAHKGHVVCLQLNARRIISGKVEGNCLKAS